jgi:hypothetical protein
MSKCEALAFYILKNADKFRSFVIEEAAMADLLNRAWLPSLRKIKKQLAGSVDFKTGRITSGKALDFGTWLTPDMYNSALEEQWGAIEKQAKKYLSRSYRRAFSEKGKSPVEAPISLENVLNDPEEGTGESGTVGPLLNLVREGFLTHLEKDVIPKIQQLVTSLHQLQILERTILLDQERASAVVQEAVAKFDKEVMNFYEVNVAKISLRLSASRQDKLKQTRRSVKDSLADILAGSTPKSAMLANLAVARAHNFGFLDWAWRSGVDYYKISSILDNKVCAACLAMNGKVFSVRDALKWREQFWSVVGDTEKMKETVPFLTKEMADNVAFFAKKSADEQFFFPPFHPGCRCICVKVDEAEIEVPPQEYPYEADFRAFEDNYEAITLFAETYYMDWYNALSDEEKFILYEYRGKAFKEINNRLRFGASFNKKTDEIIDDRIKTLFGLFTVSVPENIVSYRYVDRLPDFLEPLTKQNLPFENIVGLELIIDKGFISSSLSNIAAKTTYGSTDTPVMLRFFTQSGLKSALYIDFARPEKIEYELLVMAGTRGRILRADSRSREIDILVLK